MKAEAKVYTVKFNGIYASSVEDWLNYTAPFRSLGFDVPEKDSSFYWTPEDKIVSAETLLSYNLAGIRLEDVTTINVNVDIEALANKPLTITTDGGNEYNNHVEVHMPGQALSLYNDVLLLEDACTDRLQSHLVDGWRIIAACPQPNQRRPDYILGRYNPNRDNDRKDASRG